MDDQYDIEGFTWIVVLGAIASFCAAFGIGANDVANAYATSVGSKALTMKQACLLAVIFESAGAIFLGSHVTKTIRKGIADASCFEDDPVVLMYGCLCVIMSVGLWLLVASYLEMPVSTTHSAVGGMLGMALVTKGSECVVWNAEADDFPYIKGVSAIVASWVLSPILSGVCALFFFMMVRTFVLRSGDSYNRAFLCYPILVFVCIAINAFFIIYKGDKDIGEKLTVGEACGYSLGAGIICALLAFPLYGPPFGILRKTIDQQFEADALKTVSETETGKPTKIEVKAETADAPTNSIQAMLSNSLNMDVHAVIDTDEVVAEIHANAEKFDPKTEAVFRYLQIITAIFDSFAHGANDVANAVGPFATIYFVYTNKVVGKKNEGDDNMYWILALGGIGISVGLLLYGYKILRAIGVKLAVITPSRGFSIELGSALIIIIGSRMGWPLSTTHCQVGATTFVAWAEDVKCSGINKWILMKTVFGWIITLVVVGFTVSVIISQGLYAPSLLQPRYVQECGARLEQGQCRVVSGICDGNYNLTGCDGWPEYGSWMADVQS